MVNVTGTSQIGLSVGSGFLDMIGLFSRLLERGLLVDSTPAFQGASGYATAKVLFDVGPIAFVTNNGYTLESFEASFSYPIMP